MQLSTLRYQGYTARITNLSTMEELQDWVSECNITLPQSNLISSMEARFQLEEKKINKGNEVKIEILDDVGNVLYSLQGEANIPKRTKSYTGLEVWEYTIKDSYNRLFEKVVPESQTFYDLYLCNTNDKHNSLLHKIASALGFREEELDFQSVAFDNGNLIRLPFVYLEENSRWIDKLQAFIEATDGILYVKNKKLFYRPRNFTINNTFSFDRTNIITSLEESEKEVLQNGIRLVYDRYEKLDNQVVFNLQKKIITEANTNQDTEVPTMRISFITSAVSNPTLTKATGYYFKTDDPSSKVDITLEENVHYKKVSWKETGAEVKFYNPLPYKLYVDNFEIKGVPLSMYSDNEVSVMFPNVLEKHQENFITSSKNKFIQTSEQAKFLAKKAMRRVVVNHAEYQFKTPFLHQIEVGGVYGLDLEDIHTVIEITNISINLRPGVFRMDIQGISDKEELGSVKITSKLSGNPKESYIDLRSVEEELKKQNGELKKLDRDVRSKLHKMNKVPTENVEENDIWLNPDTNEWKKFYNGVWNPISEKEILPSMKMYSSLDGNVIKLQGTTDKVGAYLLNDGEKFGSLNGELAHVTFDKLGQFEAENPNNRVALNIKDPANPYRVTSQVLLGVTDVTDSKWKNTIFAIGDEATGNRIEFKQGKLSQKINGQELEKKLSDVDKNIINLAQADSENKKELEKRINKVKTNINAQLVNADKKWTALQGQYQETVKDITSFKTQTSKSIDTVQGALQQGNFIITANTTFDGDARFVSRGSNEVITIANGAIDFHRDGKRLTRIKNIRHGTISTDSTGKGVVDFEGFQQPMIVVPSIKSLDAGKNIAKFFCFAEHIERCKYRFFVGVSNEYWVEATPIKVVGTQWTAENAMNSTFLKYEGKVDYGPGQKIQIYGSEGEHGNHWKYIEYKLFPEINVKITRIDGDTTLLVDKNYKMTGGVDDWRVSGRYNLYFTTWLNVLDFSQTTNLLKRYANRTNVKFIMQVSITQPEFRAYIAHDWHYTRGNFDNKETTYYGVHKEVVLARITSSHLTGLALTASSSTSTLGEVTGEGEVSYIAMEID
ncbi:hypothetical protein BSQ88_08895 [Fusobacterium necrophorum subsp. funduliforme]|uniref:hypothetical protein n=1 Tax=Fusobacterium necrophorum TaxID=859 RepID=UPI000F4682EA|nr:hypothetical protein [Fusobacterium necrophorum]AYV93778.1 hypothetical protein BSQ88_08895 [Fusobacterium necrophorum subsp. funduliforme]